VNISSVSATATGESGQLMLSIDLAEKVGAIIYCAVFVSTDYSPGGTAAVPSKPASNTAVIAQQHSVVTTNSHNSILVSGLQPYTPYDAYCLTEALTGAVLPYAAVLATRAHGLTKCCKTVEVDVKMAQRAPAYSVRPLLLFFFFCFCLKLFRLSFLSFSFSFSPFCSSTYSCLASPRLALPIS